eukprot:TRINITY_DN9520_c0_g1_i1.p1 TRINITY_DN9520_c0_g1~~TRINITY_DN9520_c0_g1_i1.p1  ORF type:complete len:909 (+),score=93.54 TRINITY_DN9520_c0_g1_i1:793-3519(+)
MLLRGPSTKSIRRVQSRLDPSSSSKWALIVLLTLVGLIVQICLLVILVGRASNVLSSEAPPSSASGLSVPHNRSAIIAGVPPGRQPLRIGVLTTYPPQYCGIGEFSIDLWKALGELQDSELHAQDSRSLEVGILVLDAEGTALTYGPEVRYVIRKHAIEDYVAASIFANSNFDVIICEHEFGIFGGIFGDFLFAFFQPLVRPVLVTLHTVLRDQPAYYVDHLSKVFDMASHVSVFMPDLCNQVAAIHPSVPCTYIPHGHGALSAPSGLSVSKQHTTLLRNRTLLVTAGLLGASKGIKFMIAAMEHVIKIFPDALYVIVGSEHPESTDPIMRSLRRAVRKANAIRHVHFVSSFQSKEQLLEWMALASVVVLPYIDAEQISSGALSMSMGLGAAVVATRFRYSLFLCLEEADRQKAWEMEQRVMQREVLDAEEEAKAVRQHVEDGRKAALQNTLPHNVERSFDNDFVDKSTLEVEQDTDKLTGGQGKANEELEEKQRRIVAETNSGAGKREKAGQEDVADGREKISKTLRRTASAVPSDVGVLEDLPVQRKLAQVTYGQQKGSRRVMLSRMFARGLRKDSGIDGEQEERANGARNTENEQKSVLDDLQLEDVLARSSISAGNLTAAPSGKFCDLVPRRDPKALAAAVISLLGNASRLANLKQLAWDRTRSMTWHQVALKTYSICQSAVEAGLSKPHYFKQENKITSEERSYSKHDPEPLASLAGMPFTVVTDGVSLKTSGPISWSSSPKQALFSSAIHHLQNATRTSLSSISASSLLHLLSSHVTLPSFPHSLAAKVVQELSQGGLLFSSWSPPPARLQLTIDARGQFRASNGLTQIHGDLLRGFVHHSAPSDGLLFGLGVHYSGSLLHFTFGEKTFTVGFAGSFSELFNLATLALRHRPRRPRHYCRSD